MLEILKMQALIKDINLSDTQIMHFTLNGIPAKAMDYDHSICIGLFFIEKKMISDSTIYYISLMLMALEDTQDFALQLKSNDWWLWYRHTISDRINIDDEHHELSIKLHKINELVDIFSSLATPLKVPKKRILSEHKIDVSKVAV
ncbi:hypothetical protein [Yersinia rochesterensis]|uniref:hypothetical protein n=1 Tax=Yersinia rochesterensis TaxID=1604335 RepID=UPI0011A4981B|nr:hypothetical protein [Yersinia rochesterensis]MDN0108874.1 hypothetical protein [Yersinia rochesterensis]